jgi:diacylglycerol kinase family enzyme
MNFKQIIIILNPKSTNADLALRHIQEITQIFKGIPLEIIRMTSSSLRNLEKLRQNKDKLGPKTLFCIAGGDGTVNLIVEFLQSDKKITDAARQTVLLPLWAGNANDLAHMINGPVSKIRLPALLESAKVTAIYPLACTLTDSNGRSRAYRAANYAGFGVTASVARVLNGRSHRARWSKRLHMGRVLAEALTVWRTFADFSGFKIKEGDSRSVLYERSYVNGSRMGRLQPLAASLTERSFLQTTVYKKDKHIFAFYRWLRGSVKLASKNTVIRRDQFTTEDSIWMQCDGEPVHLEKDTQVVVECSELPLFVLATKLEKAEVAKRKFKK